MSGKKGSEEKENILPETKKPFYGNWISGRLIGKCILLFSVFALAEFALCAWVPGLTALKTITAATAVLCLVCAVYFCSARRMFSAEGRDVQNRVLDHLISHIEWDGQGRALDIGCGSGALTVRTAEKYPGAAVTGIDSWGKGWGYSREQCMMNARAAGVDDRTDFREGSASNLPFADGTFDLVVSNLTFHEVRDVKSKLDALNEALRVLRPGGGFVFQDLFLIRQYYGTPDELNAALKAMGAADILFIDGSKEPFIPKALKLPFMLGTLALVRGVKV